MPLPLLRSLIWIDYRLLVLFAIGLPIVLVVWASVRQEQSLVRLLGLYAKVASLLAVTVLLQADARPLSFITGWVAQLLIPLALWFWVDINEEISDLPPLRPLPLTLRIWRWALTLLCAAGVVLGTMVISCAWTGATAPACRLWIEAPQAFHGLLATVLGFLFGAAWTPGLSAVVGYAGLAAYLVGAIQWLLVRLPRQGRLAGGF